MKRSIALLTLCLWICLVVTRAATPGSVLTWGDNSYGQGDIPPGLDLVRGIAGGSHTVALKANGSVVAWGLNNHSQSIVPAGLTNVAAIAAGDLHTLALISDGGIVAWGNNGYAQTSVPSGLSNVTAIAAGWYHNIALKSDHTVVAWGNNEDGQTSVPAGLNNVIAVEAGSRHTVALKSNGVVVAWGYNDSGQTNVPNGLTNVVAIAAGGRHTVALRADGTVVAWGYNGYGQTSVPVGLSTVTAIAAGGLHTVALKSNGTTVAWGYNNFGQTNIPTGLSNVTAIAAGNQHTIVIAYLPPRITSQPIGQIAVEGLSAQFNLTATGTGLSYQWRKDGTNIPGETSTRLMLSPVHLEDAGLYSVIVSNELGTVLSSSAFLVVIPFGTPAVLVDGEPVAGNLTREGATTLALQTAFPQGHIFYTLDGSAPTFASPLYAGPITIANTVVVRALASSSDFSQTAEAPAVTLFVRPFTVNATSGGAGLAAVSPVQSYYESNSLVTLTATPDSGWSFLRWERDASGSSNPLELTVNRSTQVQAIFGTSLLTNVVGSGRIEITPGGPVPYGSTVELRAVSGPGQKFMTWGSAVSGTNNPRLYTVTQPGPTVTALFAAAPLGFPVITNQPLSRAVPAGGDFVLSVGASGSGPLRYQWRLNGASLTGATNATLNITGATEAQAGAYDVLVSGADGTAASDKAAVVLEIFEVRPVVSLLGAAGTGFRVEYTDAMEGGPWLPLTNGVLSGERREVIDLTSTNRSRRFYRTRIEP